MRRPPLKLTCTALFHGVAGLNIYMDYALLNPMVTFVKDFTNQSVKIRYGAELSPNAIQWFWGSYPVIFMLGCVFGSSTIGYPISRLGYRNTMMVLKNLLALCAAALHTISKPCNSFELLMLGHFVSGVATGQAVTTVPVFVSLTSPLYCRGFLSTMCSCMGTGLAVILSAIFGTLYTEDNWNYFFLCQVPFSVMHLAATPLVKFRDDGRDTGHSNKPKVNLVKALGTKHHRWPLILCTLVLVSLPLGGYELADFYSTSTLIDLGAPRESAVFYSFLLVKLPAFVLVITAAVLLEKVGRRPLLLTGMGLFAVGGLCWLLSTPVAHYIDNRLGIWLRAAGLGITVAGKIGAPLLGFVLPAELAPQDTRALTMSVANSMFFGLLLLALILFPPISRVLHSYCILPCIVFSTVAFIFLYKYFPETRNKTVEEIGEIWKGQTDENKIQLDGKDVSATLL